MFCYYDVIVLYVILHLMGKHTFRIARGVTLVDPIYSYVIFLVYILYIIYYSCVEACRLAIGVFDHDW
jgi:hypothetical protein